MGPDEDLDATAAAVLKDEDGYTPAEELTEDRAQDAPKNLQFEIMNLPVGKRLKLALKGNRDVRAILMRDPNIVVQRFLIENPRLTDEEVISIAKSRNADQEVLGRIAKRLEWVRNYQVRLALVTNPKTPMGLAIRFVNSLMDRDIRLLAKNRNVPSVVSVAARRIVLNRS